MGSLPDESGTSLTGKDLDNGTEKKWDADAATSDGGHVTERDLVPIGAAGEIDDRGFPGS